MASEDKGTAWYAQLAERAAECALGQMRDNEDAGAALSLAAAAWDVVMGLATEHERADMNQFVLTEDGGYEIERVCICPPDLVERGGFKGRCPVHAA